MSEDLDELNKILSSGVKSVVNQGTRIEYTSVDEQLKARRVLQNKEGKPYRCYDVAHYEKGV